MLWIGSVAAAVLKLVQVLSSAPIVCGEFGEKVYRSEFHQPETDLNGSIDLHHRCRIEGAHTLPEPLAVNRSNLVEDDGRRLAQAGLPA